MQLLSKSDSGIKVSCANLFKAINIILIWSQNMHYSTKYVKTKQNNNRVIHSPVLHLTMEIKFRSNQNPALIH